MWLFTKEYVKSGKYTDSSFCMLRYKNTKLTDLACTIKKKVTRKQPTPFSVFYVLIISNITWNITWSRVHSKHSQASQWPHSGGFIVNFEHFSNLYIVCLWTGKCLLGEYRVTDIFSDVLPTVRCSPRIWTFLSNWETKKLNNKTNQKRESNKEQHFPAQSHL